MAYSTREISNQDGRPVFLYEFRYDTSYYRYTSADQPLTFFAGEPEEVIYEPISISDGGFTQGGSDQNDFQITMPVNTAVAEMFKNRKPSGKLWLTVRAWHYGDPDTEQQIQWLGTVTNSIWVDRATAQLSCRSIGGTYDRNGLRLVWQRSCPHVLYGVGCYVDKTEHAYSALVDGLTANSFSVTEELVAVEGSFAGGFVEWPDADGNLQRRGIEQQVADSFVILGTSVGMIIGELVTIYPGCGRSTAHCKNFDNLPNFGGFPHMPGKSPFDGTPVF